MDERSAKSTHRSEPVPDKFYLPAATLPRGIGRVEAALSDLLGGHDLVPIPRDYGR